ncbi:hypothetical protein IW138_001146 [Coemansia sp. RSA 986]|nr:hypothetical protein IW138_001146 [Coemansia sp. RSA 986]
MSGVLGGLAAFEVSELKAKRTVKGMFWIAFVAIFGSALAVGLLGAAFAMNFKPLLAAPKFIPIIGMLYGNTMVGVALGVDTVLSTADLRRDSVEAMMCYGASRWETVLPIVVDAARTAMLPTITSLSITGLIAIPGMMSGQILGGADVLDAARYQQVIMFMIAACVALGVVFSVIYVAFAVIDSSPKLHAENIHIKAKVDAHNGNKNGKRSNGQGTPTLSGSNNMVHMKAWKSSNVQLA